VKQVVTPPTESALTNYENLPIQIKAANAAAGAFTAGTGTNTLTVSVIYKVVNLTA
jgi:hypothetical protein